MKKFVSIATAVALCFALATSAFAADITANGGTGEVELQGNITANPALISVAMPTSINFEIGITAENTFSTVVSGTGTVTNNSNIGVKLSLTNVADDVSVKILDKVNLYLDPEGATTHTNALSEGMAPVDLATLAANGGKVNLKVFGEAKEPSTTLTETDGADVAFTVVTTLKVEKAV